MPDEIQLLIATLLMLPGLIGTLMPALPGIPLMFLIVLFFAIIDRFDHLSWSEIGWLSLITILSLIIDYAAGVVGAKLGGASKQSILSGFFALIIGTIMLPPFGGILGMFIVIAIMEYSRQKSQNKALKAAGSSLLGALTGSAINFILALIFIGLFITFSLA
jgi:uncharacterized protein YqgC (DUF456 family)